MFRTVIIFIVCSFWMVGNFLFVPFLLLSWIFRQKRMFMAIMQFSSSAWAKGMIWLTGSKVSITGLENIPAGNALFVGNHQGFVDILLVYAYIPRHIGFIAKIELARVPLMNFWMAMLHCVFMDRKSLKKSAKAIETGIRYLKEGYSMVIFPEGHRSKGGPMRPFKSGSLKLAFQSGAPIVPITLSGTYKIYEETYRAKPADVKIIIHPAIETKNLSDEEKDKMAERLHDLIQSAL